MNGCMQWIPVGKILPRAELQLGTARVRRPMLDPLSYRGSFVVVFLDLTALQNGISVYIGPSPRGAGPRSAIGSAPDS